MFAIARAGKGQLVEGEEERRRKLLDCLLAVSMFPCEILWVQSTLWLAGSFSFSSLGSRDAVRYPPFQTCT